MELTRRAFLEGVFGASLGSALAAQTGCRTRTRRIEQVEGRMLGQSVEGGHLLRGELGDRIAHVANLPAREVEVAVVGAGPSGLSAARALSRGGVEQLVVLELEPELGGTARAGSSEVTAYPWGAHYLPVPQRHNRELIALLEEMGVVRGVDEQGAPVVTEPHLVRTLEERLYYKGSWYPGLYLEAGASESDLRERARFEQLVTHWVQYRDGVGRRAFTIPLRLASDAPEVRALDALPAGELLERHGLRSPRLLWLLDYACRDDFGTGLAHTSAWALLFYFAARIERPGGAASELITWPEGNFALVRQLARGLGTKHAARTLVFDVRQEDERVELLAWDLARDVGTRYRARRAVLATPEFVTLRMVRELREQRATVMTPYAPWLVANLHLSQRPESRGAPLAWDNVLYDSPSLGYVCATHQRGSDYGETVFTYYLPLVDTDPRRARQKLYEGDYAAWRSAVLLDLGRAHPELVNHVTRLDVFRWGHGMAIPAPSLRFDPRRVRASEPLGRIHFAHGDLSGLSLFEESFDHGLRAAREILALRSGEPA